MIFTQTTTPFNQKEAAKLRSKYAYIANYALANSAITHIQAKPFDIWRSLRHPNSNPSNLHYLNSIRHLISPYQCSNPTPTIPMPYGKQRKNISRNPRSKEPCHSSTINIIVPAVLIPITNLHWLLLNALCYKAVQIIAKTPLASNPSIYIISHITNYAKY